MSILKNLIRLDLNVAEFMGAPHGFTLSGWSYKLEQDGKPFGRIFRPFIDFLFFKGHCKQAYDRESKGISELS